MNIKKHILIFFGVLSLFICFSNVAFTKNILVGTSVKGDRGLLTLWLETLDAPKVCIFDLNFDNLEIKGKKLLKEMNNTKINKNIDDLISLSSEVENVSDKLDRLDAFYHGEDVPTDDLLLESCNSLNEKKDAIVYKLLEFLLVRCLKLGDKNILVYFPVNTY